MSFINYIKLPKLFPFDLIIKVDVTSLLEGMLLWNITGIVKCTISETKCNSDASVSVNILLLKQQFYRNNVVFVFGLCGCFWCCACRFSPLTLISIREV